jgi:hypothetical protein
VADIFREVEEELRRDRAARLWKKYGRYVIALAVAVILAVAGIQAWRAYDLNRRQELSERYAAALAMAERGDNAPALDAFAELSDPGAGGYRGLAAFEEARLRVEAGDTAGAIAIWDRLAADTSLGQGFRDVALVMSVLHQMDDGDPAVLRARLEPLRAPAHAFRATARELSALLALREGDRAAARELYTAIADDRDAPSGLRSRAAQMLVALRD